MDVVRENLITALWERLLLKPDGRNDTVGFLRFANLGVELPYCGLRKVFGLCRQIKDEIIRMQLRLEQRTDLFSFTIKFGFPCSRLQGDGKGKSPVNFIKSLDCSGIERSGTGRHISGTN